MVPRAKRESAPPNIMSGEDDGRALSVFVHYHVLYDDDEPGSNASLAQLQNAHNELNDDFNARNADLEQIPSSGRYAFRSLVGNANIAFLPAVLQPDNVRRVNYTGKRLDAAGVGNYYYYADTLIKASSTVDHVMNVYVFPERLVRQTGTAGWGFSNGENKIFACWRYIGSQSKQRGVLTHEMAHSLTLEHVFEGRRNSDCSQKWPDVPSAKNTNWLRDTDRKADPCRYDAVSNDWFGRCDNYAVDLALGRVPNAPDSERLSCPTNAHENPFNMMDYSTFRRMFTAAQVAQMRAYVIANPTRYSGPTNTQPDPPVVTNASGERVRFLRPYHLVHTVSAKRLGLVPFLGANLAVPVDEGDDAQVTVFLNSSDTQFNDDAQLLSEGMLVTLAHFSTAELLVRTVANAASQTLVFAPAPLALGDVSAFTVRTATSKEPITTATPVLLTLASLQLTPNTAINSIELSSQASYWHFVEADTSEVARPPAPVVPPFPLDEPAQLVRYNELYRIVRLSDQRQLNLNAEALQWVPAELGGAPFLLKHTNAAIATSEALPNLGLATLQAQTALAADVSDVDGNSGLLQLTAVGSGSSVLFESASNSSGNGSGVLTTNTPLRLQLPTIPGFHFVDSNQFNAATVSATSTLLVRLQLDSGLSVDTTVDSPTPAASAFPTGVAYGNRVFVQATSPFAIASGQGERVGFYQSAYGWVSNEWDAEQLSPFQFAVEPPAAPGPAQSPGQPLLANDRFRLRFADFSTWATRRADDGLLWFTSNEALASTFQLFGSDASDMELVWEGTQWLARTIDGIASFSTNRSMRALSLSLIQIGDPASPPPLSLTQPSGVQFGERVLLSLAQDETSFGFVDNAQTEFGFGSIEPFELELVGGSSSLQTGNVFFETSTFRARYTRFDSWMQTSVDFASFEEADASPLVLLESPSSAAGLHYVADAANSELRLGFLEAADNTSGGGGGLRSAVWSTDPAVWAPIRLAASADTNTFPAPVAASARIAGVDILFDRPYQLVRPALDGTQWEIGTIPYLDNANLVAWVPRGTGHGVVMSVQSGVGPIQHNALVFVHHVTTDSTLAFFADNNPAVWLAPDSGSVYRVETQDQQPVTCVSRLRLRRFPFDEPPSYISWTRQSVAGTLTVDLVVTKNDPAYLLSVECMDDSIAFRAAPTQTQRMAARMHYIVGERGQGQRRERQRRLPSTFPRVSRHHTTTQDDASGLQLTGGGDDDPAVLAFEEYSRLVHTPSGRQLFPDVDAGSLAFVESTPANATASLVEIVKENTTGVLAQGDNGWIVSSLFQNRAFAGGAFTGAPFFFGTPAAGTKFRFEGAAAGEAISDTTLLRCRLVFPQSTLPTNLFLNVNPMTFAAVVGTDDSFVFAVQDQAANVHPKPLSFDEELTYDTPILLVDRATNAIVEEADELAAGGGGFGLYFAPRHHGTKILLQAPTVPEDEAGMGGERRVCHGQSVFIVHAVGQRQIAFDAQQQNRLDFVALPGGAGALEFTVEASESVSGEPIVVGDAVRFRERASGLFLERDVATGTARLGGNSSFSFAIRPSDIEFQQTYFSQIVPSQTDPGTTPTPTPGGDGDDDNTFLEQYWWILLVSAVAVVIAIVVALLATRARSRRRRAAAAVPPTTFVRPAASVPPPLASRVTVPAVPPIASPAFSIPTSSTPAVSIPIRAPAILTPPVLPSL